jgi:uncharacterized protein DUF4145
MAHTKEPDSMADQEKILSEPLRCGHCNNIAPMEKVAIYARRRPNNDPDYLIPYEESDCYELLLCLACDGVILRKYYWHDGYMETADDVVFHTLYPTSQKNPSGLPGPIQQAYDAAVKVKSIDTNAYAVLIRRLLEMICEDRKATGRDLSKKLEDLAKNGEIPPNLVGVAHGLRNLGNVGAHAVLGDLTPAEIPILDDLSRAILEYVYSAPALAQQAQDRFNALKKK